MSYNQTQTQTGICCYSFCHWYYTSFRRLFSKDSTDQPIVYVDNPLHSPLVEKCHLCRSNVNPESTLIYHARDSNLLVNDSTLLCDVCIQRLYYEEVEQTHTFMRFAKL